MILTLEQLKKILPLNKEVELWLPIVNKYLPLYHIDTRDRIIMFFAQCNVESVQFKKLEENLYYTTPERVAQIFKSRFDLNKNKVIEPSEIAHAANYIKNPYKLANAVYANRFGNGDEASGDGWLYRGQGVIGLTFKNTYLAFATFLGKSLSETMQLMKTKDGCLLSAIFYWQYNQLNSFADAKDVRGATKRINPGMAGIDERVKEYNRISSIIL